MTDQAANFDNLSRAIGHLEGRQDSIEARVARNEQLTERGLNSLGDKIDGLGKSIDAMRNENAGRDGQIKGGKQVIIVLWTIAAALASALVAVWKYILHP